MESFSSSYAGSTSADLSAILGIFIGILLVALAVGIVFYILGSLGLMKIANKNGVSSSFLAWIPFLNFFLLGKIAFKKTLWAVVLFVLSVAYPVTLYATINVNKLMDLANSTNVTTITSFTPNIFASILAMIFVVMYFVALYKIYSLMSTKAVLMIVLSIFFSFLVPIFLFAIRKNDVINNPNVAVQS